MINLTTVSCNAQLRTREEWFRVVAFGPARALEWLRQHQHHLGAGAALSDRLGALRTKRWLVRREGFLSQAYRLLGAYLFL